MDDKLIYYGDSLKVISQTNDQAVVGGYVARYGSPKDTDADREYFTTETDFDIKSGEERSVYFHHGLDRNLKNRRLGRATITYDEVGAWAESVIELSDRYAQKIVQFIKEGRLGYSSGTAPHLVERQPVEGATHIKYWPIAEVSITPTPAEPRNRVYQIKSIELDSLFTTTDDVKTTDTSDQSNSNAFTTMTSDELKSIVDGAVKSALDSFKPSHPAAGANSTPAIIKSVGDNADTALASFIKSKGADVGGIKSFLVGDREVNLSAIKTSENSTMNITASGAGVATVPTGHYGRIMARRNELALWDKLGVTNVSGKGTTVTVPVDSDPADPFVATGESAAFDRDRPVIQPVQMTLVKYTKNVELTEELMQDEDSNLMSFIENYVSRGLAKTENALLIAAIQAGANQLGTFGASAVSQILEEAVLAGQMGYYLDEGAAFVMQPATFAALQKLVVSGERAYQQTSLGNGRNILGYPVYFSHAVPAIGTGNRSVYFGAFSNAVRREGMMTMLFDPYSRSTNGETRLLYSTRLAYNAGVTEATGFIRHA